jgi:hypothetical protein
MTEQNTNEVNKTSINSGVLAILRTIMAKKRPSKRQKISRLKNFRNASLIEKLSAISTFIIVAGVMAFVISQLYPGLIFEPTMDVGGDTAGHIVAVYYFIHHILPSFRLTGWDPQWFDGFPLYTFYFPFPPLVMAFFSWFVPYAVAFKMGTALGIIAMPLAAYAMGRMVKAPRPIPALMSVGVVLFVFNNWFTIDGGNVMSTMAGEYSFTLSMTLMLLFIGAYVKSLTTGRGRYLAVMLFLFTALSHIVPAMFAGGAAVILTLVYPDKAKASPKGKYASNKFKFLVSKFTSWSSLAYRRPTRVLITVGVASLLVSLFWLLPFGVYGIKDGLTSSLNNGRVLNSFWYNMFPPNVESAVLGLALLGGVAAITKKDRFPTALFILTLISAALFQWAPSALIYNGRWIPFWFLLSSLLAAYGVKEIGVLLKNTFALKRYFVATRLLAAGNTKGAQNALGKTSAGKDVPLQTNSWFMGVGYPIVVALTTILLMASWLGVSPFGNFGTLNPSDGWTTFNYKGYQSEPGWTELERLTQMLDYAGQKFGCGRLDYEYGKNTSGWFGSTDYTISIPYWTNGCMDTTQGLYYQSSTTTDFHFLDASELEMDASRAVVGLPYENFNIADGVRHLQLYGVKYFLANSPQAEAQAAQDPSLVEVGTTPASPYSVDYSGTGIPTAPPGGFHWDLYLIKNSKLVVPLSYKPVVEAGISKTQFLNTAIAWYQNEQYWQVPIARTGPSDWERVAIGSLVAPSPSDKVFPTSVSAVTTTASSLTFHVSRLGSPVLIKEPYFPNWQVTGASGPYEVTPNLMVVIPTSHMVHIAYGTTSLDWIGRVATIAGIVMVIVFTLRGPATPLSPITMVKEGDPAIDPDQESNSGNKSKHFRKRTK